MFSEIAVLGLSFIAGILSTLSPCVLPLIPILAAAAINSHRLGLLALAGGLTLSFTIVGLLLASVGSVFGLDQIWLRNSAAVMLIVFGAILFSKRLQIAFTQATSCLSHLGQPWLTKISGDNLSGQLLLGMVLGIVWSPCVGPTLGAAITLASQGGHLLHTALVMIFFGVGAGLPLIALGYLSQHSVKLNKAKLLLTGQSGKIIFGALLMTVGILIISGLDKAFEAWVLNHAPTWLISLTTSI